MHSQSTWKICKYITDEMRNERMPLVTVRENTLTYQTQGTTSSRESVYIFPARRLCQNVQKKSDLYKPVSQNQSI